MPQSLINTAFVVRAYGNATSTNKYIINTSNANTMKFWSGNIGQIYAPTVLSPSGTTLATIGVNVAESSAITIDVSNYDYIRIITPGTANADAAYKFVN